MTAEKEIYEDGLRDEVYELISRPNSSERNRRLQSLLSELLRDDKEEMLPLILDIFRALPAASRRDDDRRTIIEVFEDWDAEENIPDDI